VGRVRVVRVCRGTPVGLRVGLWQVLEAPRPVGRPLLAPPPTSAGGVDDVVVPPAIGREICKSLDNADLVRGPVGNVPDRVLATVSRLTVHRGSVRAKQGRHRGIARCGPAIGVNVTGRDRRVGGTDETLHRTRVVAVVPYGSLVYRQLVDVALLHVRVQFPENGGPSDGARARVVAQGRNLATVGRSVVVDGGAKLLEVVGAAEPRSGRNRSRGGMPEIRAFSEA
jgi:hypothetical protein